MPPILKAIEEGTTIPKVSIQFTVTSGTTETTYLDMELTNVTFTGFSGSSGGSYPAEEFNLTYQKVSYSYTYNSKAYTFCWDLATKTAC